MEDLTGKLVTKEDINEILTVVTKYMVIGMLKLPPELAVQLPNIRRCLLELLENK